ncbi:hypothetical protein [Acinetobacter proteolyticus]|uniref:Uncharacterized protein n=1 Tax=Acinetobacter proteolyticus TaxID=1776741 RepID=A0A2N0WIA7_9GAMM|nr:hypothetical protein [Acinetobacter proteolyticus]PKF35501.1 hypothetical protein CW311_04220 [Acinetobacter proteolyticus]
MKKLVSKDNQQLNPAMVELVRMGYGLGNTIVSAPTREGIRQNLRSSLAAAKERMRKDVTT